MHLPKGSNPSTPRLLLEKAHGYVSGLGAGGVQAVLVVICFLVVTWAVARTGMETEEYVVGNCEKEIPPGLQRVVGAPAANATSLIIHDTTSTQWLSRPDGPLRCRGKGVDYHKGQVALLKNSAELKVFLDSLNVTYWVDGDNLASITRDPSASGISEDSGLGHFHPLDTTFELGMLASDVPLIYAALQRQIEHDVNKSVAFVGAEGEGNTTRYTLAADVAETREALFAFDGKPPPVPRWTHLWKASSLLLLTGFDRIAGKDKSGVVLHVLDKSVPVSVILTAYASADTLGFHIPQNTTNWKREWEQRDREARDGTAGSRAKKVVVVPDATYISAASLLPLGQCVLYQVSYPCPADPSAYLDELAGGSWIVSKRQRSNLKWVLILLIFILLAYWVFRRT
ncbi:hypothetical protein DIPPA_06144 [Diplonema papillatum]|nr:hypothetical protein DIPPA_34107 [Diplonema papillatum]KAJ9466981.1 hypothetical protein DIPPA_06144 [Diplonema papillatum]